MAEDAKPAKGAEGADNSTPSESIPLTPDPTAVGEGWKPEEMEAVLGVSGQKFQGGQSGEEYHSDLTGSRDALAAIYDQMRVGNALVAGPLGRIEAQIRQAEIHFAAAPRVELAPSILKFREEHGMVEDGDELADLEHQAVQFHNSWLLGGPAPEYGMETSFKQQMLHEALTFLAFPSAMFEIVWRKVEGRFGTKIVPQRLAWMHPRSIRAFKIDQSGRFLGIVQEAQHGWDDRRDESVGGQQKRHTAFIPADRLLVLSRNREGTLPEGTPFTRHMYADSERASHAVKWQMVDTQNRAVGIPFVQIPKGVNGKIIDSVKRQARRMTYGNQHLAYVVAPEGIEVGYVDMTANTVNLNEVIKAQERRMRHVTGTEFTALGGESGTGALALAKILREEFNVVVQGVWSSCAEDLREGLIKKVHRLNFGDKVAAPTLEAGGLLAVDPEDLANLVKSKVIPADRDVANVARRSIGLGPLPPDTSNEIDTSQLNDLAIAKAAVMTGAVLDAIHEKMGLPPLPPELRAHYDREPLNMPKDAPDKGSPSAPGARGSTPSPEPDAPPGAPAPSSFAAAGGGAGVRAGRSGRKASGEQLERARKLKDKRKALEAKAVKRLQKARAKIVREVAARAQITENRPMRIGGRLTPGKTSRIAFGRELNAILDEFIEFGRKSMREEAKAYAKARGRKLNLSSTPIEIARKRGLGAKVIDELALIVELNVNAILNAIEGILRDAYRRARGVGEDAATALETATREAERGDVTRIKHAAGQLGGTGTNTGRSMGLGEVIAEVGEGEIEFVTRVHLPEPGSHCEPCDDLEGLIVRIDSDQYEENEPPKHCEGRHRCHCVYMLGETDEEGKPLWEDEGKVANFHSDPSRDNYLEKHPGIRERNFRAWFGSSEVVDDDGNPLVVYHGTTQDFTEFDPEKGNIEGNFGKGLYFTNDLYDVGENYADDEGADLQSKLERLADRLEYEEGLDAEAAMARARELLIKHDGAVMPVYLRMENPVRIGGGRETWFQIETEWDEEGDWIGESGTGVDFLDAFTRTVNGSSWDPGYHDVDLERVKSDIVEKMIDGVGAFELFQAIRQSEGFAYSTDDEGNHAGGEILRATLERMGFDGIIDRAVSQKFRNMGLDVESTHYIVFEPEQIKSATGNSGAYDPNDPDITRSAAKETVDLHSDPSRNDYLEKHPGGTANTGSPKFKRWFGDSKVVGHDGKPLMVFHGPRDPAPFTKFDDFDENRVDQHFFTDDKDLARRYAAPNRERGPGRVNVGKMTDSYIIPAYLKIENPLEVDWQGEHLGDKVGGMTRESVIRDAIAGGHDGVIFRNGNDWPDAVGAGWEFPSTIFVAFSPQQIKAAVGNSGEFNPEDPDFMRSAKMRVIDFHSDPSRDDYKSKHPGGKAGGTPEFREWFGDSKVVDENGDPLVVTHQTNAEFEEFDAGEFGFHFGTGIPEGMLGQNEIEAYLSIQNPLRMNDLGVWEPEAVLLAAYDELGERAYFAAREAVEQARWEVEMPTESMLEAAEEAGEDMSALREAMDKWRNGGDGYQLMLKRNHYAISQPVHEALENAGFDGIVYRNEGEGFADSYIAFRPEQIKSTDNSGDFNPDDPRFDFHSDPSRDDYHEKHPGNRIATSTGETLRGLNERIKAKGGRKYRADGEQDPNARLDELNLSDEERRVMDAVTLWSNGHVPAVRDPDEWNEEHAGTVENNAVAGLQGQLFEEGSVGYRADGSLVSYEEASRVLRELAAAKAPDEGRVYRGIALDLDTVNALSHAVDDGVERLNLRELSSWSRDMDVAANFAAGAASDKNGDQGGDWISVLFVMDKPKIGSYLGDLSHYGFEQEFVTSGIVTVDDSGFPGADLFEDGDESWRDMQNRGIEFVFRISRAPEGSRATFDTEEMSAVPASKFDEERRKLIEDALEEDWLHGTIPEGGLKSFHSDPSRDDYPTKHPGNWRRLSARRQQAVSEVTAMRDYRRGETLLSGLPTASMDEMTEEQVKAVQAVTLWTAANVDSVRDPSKYDESMARPVKTRSFKSPRRGMPDHYLFHPELSDYKEANSYLRSLASAPTRDGWDEEGVRLYRGISVSGDAIGDFTWLHPGARFSLNDVSSFSTSLGVTESFMSEDDLHDLDITITLENPKRGTFIGPLSRYPDEKEFITGGLVEVVTAYKNFDEDGAGSLSLLVRHVDEGEQKDFHSDPSRDDYKIKHPGGSSAQVSRRDAPKVLASLVKKMNTDEEGRTSSDPYFVDRITDEERAVVDAVTLWTNGNVDTVRDPSQFDDSMSEPIRNKSFLDGGWYDYLHVNPDAKSYQNAHEVMRGLADASTSDEMRVDGRVHRMFSLKDDDAVSAFVDLEEGDTFDLRGITSFSGSARAAERFRTYNDKNDVDIHLELVGPLWGSEIGKASAYRNEYEFVTNGEVEVVRVRRETDAGGFVIRLEVRHV